MVANLMIVFAIGVFVTFGTVMVIAGLLLYWIKK